MKEESKSTAKMRAGDLSAKCKKRGFAVGDFLTEEEQEEYALCFRHTQKESRFFFSFEGGFEGAERKVPVLWEEDGFVSQNREFWGISVLHLQLSNGTIPDHRSVLGSLLGLGLDRAVVGDIFRYENGMAVAVKDRIAPYIMAELKRIGRDPVKVTPLALPEGFQVEKQTETLCLSVSSLRLDCLVAALCRLSREDAVEYIKKGMVKVDHRQANAPDRKLSEGAVLSLRGKGRFLLSGCTGQTKSGRLRIEVLHYI